MKAKLLFILIALSSIAPPLFSQVITVKVDKNCGAFIMLDDKNIESGSLQNLVVNKGQSLIFRIQNPSGKNLVVAIKSQGNGVQFAIPDLQTAITDESPLFTDKNMVLSLSNKRFDLNRPFRLYAGCKDPTKEAKFVDFIPAVASNTAPDAVAESDLNEPSDAPSTEETYSPGSAVYDALKLANVDELTDYEFKKIIKFYFPGATVDDIAKARQVAATNPFLKTAIDSITYAQLKLTDHGVAESGKDILSSLSLSSIGGLDVTSIADGLAKFLVKRAKEELSITFFQRLKKTLDSIPDLQTLFPATMNLLSSAGDNVYDYKTYIQNLRESFKKDIGALDETLPGIIINHPSLFDSTHHHALAAALRSGCYFAGELKRQVHPGDILSNYPVGYLKYENKNWPGAIQTLQLLSTSLRDTSSADNTYWVNIKYIRQMVNDRKALKIYFGLLYQDAINNYNGIPFENKTFAALLSDFSTRYDAYDEAFTSYKLYIMRFAEKTDALNKMIKSYTEPENDSVALELYKKYFDATEDMIDYTAQAGELPLLNDQPFISNLHSILSPYLDISKAVSDLVIDINRKNYSSAINHTIYIYSKVRTRPSQAEAMALQKGTSAITNNDAFKLTFKPAVDSFARSENALNKLVKYGAFMAAVSTAQNSDEVESAIEAFALPAGSSSVKRSSAFNVSVNAYAGLFYGIEKIKDFDKGSTRPNVYGVTAPIGVAASWGRRLFFIPTGRHEWSTSIYVSLVDLGAVAAFRFKDSVAETVPTIQLKDIISPGAFLSIGIPRTPLSFNIGAQAGANLRKVTSVANDYSDNMYWRYSVSLCVDIPLFNLYTR